VVARARTQKEIDRPPTCHEPREVRILHARGDVAGMPRIPRLDVGLHPITVNVLQLSQRSPSPVPGARRPMTPEDRWSSPSADR